MELTITGDVNAESRVAQVIFEVSGPTSDHFAPKRYGDDVQGVCVGLICRDPWLEFRRRIRFSKKEKTLYMDIMLELDEMRKASRRTRKKVVIERIAEEVPAVLGKYSFRDFDKARFVEDLRNWLKGLISP